MREQEGRRGTAAETRDTVPAPALSLLPPGASEPPIPGTNPHKASSPDEHTHDLTRGKTNHD